VRASRPEFDLTLPDDAAYHPAKSFTFLALSEKLGARRRGYIYTDPKPSAIGLKYFGVRIRVIGADHHFPGKSFVFKILEDELHPCGMQCAGLPCPFFVFPDGVVD
jgi:hypothetical protein